MQMKDVWFESILVKILIEALCLNRTFSVVSATVDFFPYLLCNAISHHQLQLWDTAGQERFRKSMVAHYYRNVHAVVFVYDVTKLSSFESLPIWVQECNRHQLTYAIPRILVGNKCDIAAGRVVDTARAQKFADLHNMPVSSLRLLTVFRGNLFSFSLKVLRTEKPS
jgi:small GTP-binding protein